MIKEIEELLQKVSEIQEKYDNDAERTGECFNIFEILRVEHKELSHSAIIGELLNAKGRHRQKDFFLKEFIEYLSEKFQTEFFNEFKTEKSRSENEIGYIDILLTQGQNHIVIENKIHAKDQNTQLTRYHEKYPKAPIIYLTLDGKLPSDNSKGELKENEDFICVSYKEHIIEWLERCMNRLKGKPFIEETLKQYIITLKTITNQITSDKMEEEIIKYLTSETNNYMIYKVLKDIDDTKIDEAIVKKYLIKKIKDKVSQNSLYENWKCSLNIFENSPWIELKLDKISNGKFSLGVDLGDPSFGFIKGGDKQAILPQKYEKAFFKSEKISELPEDVKKKKGNENWFFWVLSSENVSIGFPKLEVFKLYTDDTSLDDYAKKISDIFVIMLEAVDSTLKK